MLFYQAWLIFILHNYALIWSNMADFLLSTEVRWKWQNFLIRYSRFFILHSNKAIKMVNIVFNTASFFILHSDAALKIADFSWDMADFLFCTVMYLFKKAGHIWGIKTQLHKCAYGWYLIRNGWFFILHKYIFGSKKVSPRLGKLSLFASGPRLELLLKHAMWCAKFSRL